MTMILVTGANGHLGTAVIENLLKKTAADQIAALVRDESKAFALKEKGVTLRVGNYDDSASLDAAMQGVEKVLLIAGTDEENRLRQHRNVVDAAKKAGVSCIAYTSRTLKDRNRMVNQLMEGHFQTEDHIKESGLAYVLFRNVLYMDTLPLFLGGEGVFDTGISVPAGQGQVPFALRSEMGEAIATALFENGCDNRLYKLTGSEAYSFDDVAAVLTDIAGKTVAYAPAETSAYEAHLQERGLPEPAIRRAIGFMTDIKNGQENEVTSDLENLIGRKPTSLREGLGQLFKS